MSELEMMMALYVQALREELPRMMLPVREYRFHPTRRWRFDFAWPGEQIAGEVEGGTWKYGRHNRAEGFAKDCEKYNAAALLGWRVFRFTREMIEGGQAFDTLQNLWRLQP